MDPPWKPLDQTADHLHGETCFADPAWACDRNQTHILTQQEFSGGCDFFFSPHKPGPLHRNIARARLYLLHSSLREAVAYGCKFPREISGGDVTLIGLFRQTPFDSPTQRSGDVGISHSDRFGLFLENG